MLTVLLPTGLAACALSALLRRGRAPRVNPSDPMIDGALVFAALSVAFLVGTPQPGPSSPVGPGPGTDLATALSAAPDNLLPWVQLGGNLMLLLPLGMLAPLRLGWFQHIGRAALSGLLLSCGIEIAQFFLIPGRVASTDDIVLNTTGAAVGALLTIAPGRIRAAFATTEHRITGDLRTHPATHRPRRLARQRATSTA